MILIEKEGNMIRTYDENPYNNRKFENQLTTQKPHQELLLYNDIRST